MRVTDSRDGDSLHLGTRLTEKRLLYKRAFVNNKIKKLRLKIRGIRRREGAGDSLCVIE